MLMYMPDLSSLPRCFKTAFPLSSAGIIEDHPYASVVVRGKLELCIRIASTASVAREMIGGTLYRVHYPNAILKTPETPHIFTVDHPRDAVYYKWDPSLEGAMREAGFLESPWCWDLTMNPEITGILRETRDILPRYREYGIADRLDLLALRMLEAVLLQRKHSPAKEVHMDAKIQRIAASFQLNFCKEIDLETLLKENGISRRHFFRTWNRFFTQTPAAYVQTLKLNEAARLLTVTSIPIWEITHKLGFQNSSYFCFLFKKQFKTTPLKYRRIFRSSRDFPPKEHLDLVTDCRSRPPGGAKDSAEFDRPD